MTRRIAWKRLLNEDLGSTFHMHTIEEYCVCIALHCIWHGVAGLCMGSMVSSFESVWEIPVDISNV